MLEDIKTPEKEENSCLRFLFRKPTKVADESQSHAHLNLPTQIDIKPTTADRIINDSDKKD